MDNRLAPPTFWGITVHESPHVPEGTLYLLRQTPRILECDPRPLYFVGGDVSTVKPCPKCERRELLREQAERLTARILRNVGRACPVGWSRTSGSRKQSERGRSAISVPRSRLMAGISRAVIKGGNSTGRSVP